MAKTTKGKTTAPKAAKEKAPVVEKKAAKAVAPKASVKKAAPVVSARAVEAKKKPQLDAVSLHNAVARRAYEYFLARGGEIGHEVEDWLMAERDVLAQLRQ
jgi:hypothetical protein